MAKSNTSPVQMRLDLHIEREVEIDGVGMGVLSDGTPYLTQRGLARMCGVDHTVITRILSGWGLPERRPREAKIQAILRQQGYASSEPFIPIVQNGTVHHAFPEIVCMAVLEYYAFDANSEDSSHARTNFRLLARRSFRDFIYAKIGYDPQIAWRQFQDRVSLVWGVVPPGYFSIFKEMAHIVVTLIEGGALVDSHFVPDISVGVVWGRYWRESGFDRQFGARLRYEHSYPAYFAQAASNPQPAFCYPDAALAEFRRWLRDDYIPEHFGPYLAKKVRDGALLPAFAEKALRSVEAGSRGRVRIGGTPR